MWRLQFCWLQSRAGLPVAAVASPCTGDSVLLHSCLFGQSLNLCTVAHEVIWAPFCKIVTLDPNASCVPKALFGYNIESHSDLSISEMKISNKKCSRLTCARPWVQSLAPHTHTTFLTLRPLLVVHPQYYSEIPRTVQRALVWSPRLDFPFVLCGSTFSL
jgi:hypothetical protein